MGLKSLLCEADDMRKSGGWPALLRLGLSYLKDLLRFEYRHVFVLESSMIEMEEPHLTPELKEELSVRFVTTNQELDTLLTDGYDIHPISMGIDSLRRRIRKGAIAVLVFAGRELAHWCFMSMNEQAKKVLEPYPYRVDFANQESCSGNAQTAEKY